MEKWHAAKPGSIVDGKEAPKKPLIPVSESDSPEQIEKLEKPTPRRRRNTRRFSRTRWSRRRSPIRG